MSKNDYNAKLKEITTNGDSAIKHPNMPVGEAVQEAENLVAWSQDDKATLIKAGLDWQLVDDLPTRAGACRYAQSIWARESQSREDAQKEWNTKSPQAFDLRDESLHHFSFAFRNEPDLVRKAQIIRQGGSNTDMLQELTFTGFSSFNTSTIHSGIKIKIELKPLFWIFSFIAILIISLASFFIKNGKSDAWVSNFWDGLNELSVLGVILLLASCFFGGLMMSNSKKINLRENYLKSFLFDS